MKKWILIATCALLSGAASAQSPAADDAKRLEDLIKLVRAQQAQIAQNQTQIDAKLATIAETIRIARIYSSRGRR
ncbi:MAG TPA: hypothetical protein VGG02_11365 [Chthoniobacterales bacterium]|jgi:hypothetical protein